jgi:hypothetical protein
MKAQISSAEETEILRVYENAEDVAREYSINTWLEDLMEANETFVTHYFDFTVEEAKALKNSFNTPSEEEKIILLQIENKIDSLLAKLGGRGFVKLSTRSPKDVVFELKNEKVLNQLSVELLNIIDAKGLSNVTIDDELVAMTTAANKSMIVHSGNEAMQLLSQSFRVHTDVTRALQDGKLSLQCIVREWLNIPIQHEYRGFVCKKNLTGLSQYFHYIFIEQLQSQSEAISKLIYHYWNGKVKHLIKHDSYVIDFAILEDNRIKVIEINPFHYSTGAPFYGWKQGSEGRNLLFNGPFEFRFKKFPATQIDKEKYLSTCYEKKIQQIKDSYYPNAILRLFGIAGLVLITEAFSRYYLS